MPALPWENVGGVEPEREYLVMASRLPLESYLRIPQFMRMTMRVRQQLRRSDGLAGYSLLAEIPKKMFWTVSAWESREQLYAFNREAPHGEIARRLRPHMGPTRFVTWTVKGSELPISWKEAKARLSEEGRPPGG